MKPCVRGHDRGIYEDLLLDLSTSNEDKAQLYRVASLLYFVARYLGYDAHLYDGSFEDWSRRPELPVEKVSN